MMKKTAILAILLFSAFFKADAKTSPTAVDFLNKLNLYYYSPPQFGCKNFRCEAHIPPFELSRKNLLNAFSHEPDAVQTLDNLNFTLNFRDEEYEYGYFDPPVLKGWDTNRQIGALVDFGQGIMKGVIHCLNNPAAGPQFTEKELAENDYQVVNLAQGFNVVKTKDKKTWTFSFNSNALLTGMVAMDNGKVRQRVGCAFTKTKDGWLLTDMTFDDPDHQVTRFLKIQWQMVEGFHLPAGGTYREHPYKPAPTGKDFEAPFTFENFAVNETLAPRLLIKF